MHARNGKTIRMAHLLVGFAFGVGAGCLVVTAMIGWTYRPPVQSPIWGFGDVRILCLSHKYQDGVVIDELRMKRGGRLFFSLMKDGAGKVNYLAIVDGGGSDIRLCLTASPESGTWVNAVYGGYARGDVGKEVYEDIDFDGIFDVLETRAQTSSDGKERRVFIHLNDGWMAVDELRGDYTAVSGSETYTFRSPSEWLRNQ